MPLILRLISYATIRKGASISNYIHVKQWDETMHPCPNFSSFIVGQWVSNYIPHKAMYANTYPCQNLSKTILAKGTKGQMDNHSYTKSFKIYIDTYLHFGCILDSLHALRTVQTCHCLTGMGISILKSYHHQGGSLPTSKVVFMLITPSLSISHTQHT